MYSIGEIAQRAEVATSTIRYYERIGLLPPSKRMNGRRQYDGEILKKLNLIRYAQQAGFSIAEIQTLLYGFPSNTVPADRWQQLSTQKMIELDALMEQIAAMKTILAQTLECECPTLDDCGEGVA